MHKYRVTYAMDRHAEGLLKEAVPEGRGACDALVVFSLLYPADGSFSMQCGSLDGRTGLPLDDGELFKAWALLAAELAKSTTLGEGRKRLAGTVFEAIRDGLSRAAPNPTIS